MSRKLEGKVAVVTGGNSGIGLATAQRFHDEGAKVVISGRDQKTLDQAVKQIGSDVLAVRSDVSKLSDLDALYKTVREKFGKIDVLFANAGVAKFASIPESSETVYDQMFDINVKGVFFTIQKALPLLKNGAAIIINSSVANQKGVANSSVYSATKAAVRSFARTMSAELLERNIRVNVVSPGPIKTPIFGRNGLSEAEQDEIGKFLVSLVPMKRWGTVEEIANSVLFLATPDSSYIAGMDLVVDGGMTQM
jgi:NAD(P)-dependent dehydrogenase (short-subunit alcohol dehydrogenase family)